MVNRKPLCSRRFAAAKWRRNLSSNNLRAAARCRRPRGITVLCWPLRLTPGSVDALAGFGRLLFPLWAAFLVFCWTFRYVGL